MTSAIETALTELSANLRRMEQRHQATGYKFDRLYGLIDAAREEAALHAGLLREARDNCQASIAEEGISSERREYRRGLLARLEAVVGAFHE